MTLTQSSAATLPSTKASPPPASARRNSLIDPGIAVVGVSEAGVAEVPAAGDQVGVLADLDVGGEAGGAEGDRVLDLSVQEGELGSLARRLQGGGEAELGDLPVDQHRRRGHRLAVDEGEVAAPTLASRQVGEDRRGPGGLAVAERDDLPERALG